MKGAIHQDERTIAKIYMSNIGVPNFIKYILLNLKIQIDPNTVLVGDFNTPYHQWIDHPDKKINKETLELNDTIDQMDLADIYRVLHTATTQYTFLTAAHGTFSKIDHILGHKASLNKCKKIETPS
jgi:exonuclease III